MDGSSAEWVSGLAALAALVVAVLSYRQSNRTAKRVELEPVRAAQRSQIETVVSAIDDAVAAMRDAAYAASAGSDAPDVSPTLSGLTLVAKRARERVPVDSVYNTLLAVDGAAYQYDRAWSRLVSAQESVSWADERRLNTEKVIVENAVPAARASEYREEYQSRVQKADRELHAATSALQGQEKQIDALNQHKRSLIGFLNAPVA